MKKFIIHGTITVITFFVSMLAISQANQLVGARFPAAAPDGKQIAFSYMGDLWVISASGGKAVQLTNHIGYDHKPIWSADGKWLAFTSNRQGNNDVYVMKSSGGSVKQLTFHTSNDIATDFTPDGKWIIFTSNRSSMSSVYKVNIKGGNPYPVLDTYWSWLYQAKVNPNGNSLLFSSGMENSSWWRRGYRGSNSAKLWKKEFSKHQAKLIFDDLSNCFWPCWSKNGQSVYFVSDRKSGIKNIWTITVDGSNLKQVTQFTEDDINWLTVAADVPIAVYERNFQIWYTDLNSSKSHPIQIEAPVETKNNSSFFVKNGSITEYKLSPDGKKIAAVVRGEIFVLSTEGGYARNVTKTPWRERDVLWDKDSKNLFFISDIAASPNLYTVPALGNKKFTKMTHSKKDVLSPALSPDGKWIAYYNGNRQIRLLQSDGKKDHLLFEDDFGGRFADNFVWSPDSRYLAVVVRRNGQSDLFALDVSSKKKILLTNTAYDESNPLWSPDGKFMLFTSNRYGHSFPEFTGKWDIYQLHLQPEMPKFDEDKFEKLFKTEKKKKDTKAKDKNEHKDKEEKPELKIDFKLEDIDIQTKTVTNTLGNDRTFVLSPKDSNTIYFVSNIDGKNHLWKTSLEEKKRGKYEPFMSSISNPRKIQMDKKGKYLYYLSEGKLGRIDAAGKKNKSVSFDTKIEIDKIADYEQMLGELYYTLLHYYYDENHHHVNWEKLYQQFLPVLQQVREDNDFYDYANQMIGFLNSSHTGIRGPRKQNIEKPSAHIGAVWNFSPGKITLGRIIKKSPLNLHRDSLSIGDELIKVNEEKVNPDSNIWKYFNGNLNKRLTLTFKCSKLQKNLTISVKPISARTENRLFLEEWINSRKEIVKQKTGDQIAYIYMRAMGQGDLRRFIKELERDAVPRKGLILDLRNNFGGNVHDRVLQALMKPVYSKWQIRGLSETPQSTYGFADKPIVLLINEVTLSDGEMTANGFKALNRGPIIGNTSYGWLIFTTGVGLMNGGYFRLPFWGCYTLDGKDLETSGGVKPDIFVINDLNDDLYGRDPQLDKAIEKIKELIK